MGSLGEPGAGGHIAGKNDSAGCLSDRMGRMYIGCKPNKNIGYRWKYYRTGLQQEVPQALLPPVGLWPSGAAGSISRFAFRPVQDFGVVARRKRVCLHIMIGNPFVLRGQLHIIAELAGKKAVVSRGH